MVDHTNDDKASGTSGFALEWVKNELLTTLGEARDALEVYAEQGFEASRMRTCLTRVHQVHGTLVMLELGGVRVLADHLERLAQAMCDATAQGDETLSEEQHRIACQLLMRGLLELPERLERLQAGGEDDEAAVRPLVNEILALLGEPAADEAPEVALSPDAIARFQRVDGVAKAKRIRAAFQHVMVAVLKGRMDDRVLGTMHKVATGLGKICDGAPLELLWQSFEVYVASLEAGTPPKTSPMLLRGVDTEIKNLVQGGADALAAPLPDNLIVALLDDANERAPETPLAMDIRTRVSTAAVEEQLLMSSREALKSASVALREELAGVKDQLDLYVRSPDADAGQLLALEAPLRQLAVTCSVLGFESSRTILLEQLDLVCQQQAGAAVEPEVVQKIAGALMLVEENLLRASAGDSREEDEHAVGDANQAVLVETRNLLENVKQAVVDFVSSNFELMHLADVPTTVQEICGALELIGLERPKAVLLDCKAFIEQELASYHPDQESVQWERLDRFADCISGADYYLERVQEGATAGTDDVLEMVERNLEALGFAGKGQPKAAEMPEDETATDAPLESSAADDVDDVAGEAVAEQVAEESDHAIEEEISTQEFAASPEEEASAEVEAAEITEPTCGRLGIVRCR